MLFDYCIFLDNCSSDSEKDDPIEQEIGSSPTDRIEQVVKNLRVLHLGLEEHKFVTE